ncbi:hypothetical protein F383_19268 [Gossypium arboreum]|uniref:Uncharacterized protein n=2 Tax=Gossypium TaxID=3633 RepID=A0A0B0MLE7_GOSAR|nr:hypothetical protein F383_19268 [Gossypium arboreum]TYI33463.1 hypothetical protein ES332_A04G134800v1 [Gossypium tomentosum]TYI33464.1 hypothetical protein ES332_A04G134800v1 [Gossypium tomentosum]TYI33465.1 hypothetical protein ES332_A04G134800v1 [Gossypium tomentosum]
MALISLSSLSLSPQKNTYTRSTIILLLKREREKELPGVFGSGMGGKICIFSLDFLRM